MAKIKPYTSDYFNNYPEWYWKIGLHDATIVGINHYEFPFDYNNFNGKKNKSHKNLLALKINTKYCIGDISVKEIRFFNYKILTQNISLEDSNQLWWIGDRLVDNGDHYTIEIDLYDFDKYPEEFTVKIEFEMVEVDRKQ